MKEIKIEIVALVPEGPYCVENDIYCEHIVNSGLCRLFMQGLLFDKESRPIRCEDCASH